MMNDLHLIHPVLRRHLYGFWTPLLLVLLALTAPAVQAQVVINVTTFTDEVSHNNALCSLREAIVEANDFNQVSEGDCLRGVACLFVDAGHRLAAGHYG